MSGFNHFYQCKIWKFATGSQIYSVNYPPEIVRQNIFIELHHKSEGKVDILLCLMFMFYSLLWRKGSLLWRGWSCQDRPPDTALSSNLLISSEHVPMSLCCSSRVQSRPWTSISIYWAKAAPRNKFDWLQFETKGSRLRQYLWLILPNCQNWGVCEISHLEPPHPCDWWLMLWLWLWQILGGNFDFHLRLCRTLCSSLTFNSFKLFPLHC